MRISNKLKLILFVGMLSILFGFQQANANAVIAQKLHEIRQKEKRVTQKVMKTYNLGIKLLEEIAKKDPSYNADVKHAKEQIKYIKKYMTKPGWKECHPHLFSEHTKDYCDFMNSYLMIMAMYEKYEEEIGKLPALILLEKSVVNYAYGAFSSRVLSPVLNNIFSTIIGEPSCDLIIEELSISSNDYFKNNSSYKDALSTIHKILAKYKE